MGSYFDADGEMFVPTTRASSVWSPMQIGGHAVVGLCAFELEKHSPSTTFIPSRLTVDLFRPVTATPIIMRSTTVRSSSRITVVDTAVVQNNEDVTRASAVFLATGEPPAGRQWLPNRDLPVPPTDAERSRGNAALFRSDDSGWFHDTAHHQSDRRKSMWHTFHRVVPDEALTPFQNAAMVAEGTSFVSNWGTEGVGYINVDVTMTLSRLPRSDELGLHVVDHIAADGIAVGSTTLFDRVGPVGSAMTTALSNARRQVDVAATAARRRAHQ